MFDPVQWWLPAAACQFHHRKGISYPSATKSHRCQSAPGGIHMLPPRPFIL
ncbi:MAG: hypothetical protein P1U89_03620 [Verrucomicrobiales bacterium]|nr:hypothetical protein [Verrucomicrobiales bacterium]